MNLIYVLIAYCDYVITKRKYFLVNKFLVIDHVTKPALASPSLVPSRIYITVSIIFRHNNLAGDSGRCSPCPFERWQWNKAALDQE